MGWVWKNNKALRGFKWRWTTVRKVVAYGPNFWTAWWALLKPSKSPFSWCISLLIIANTTPLSAVGGFWNGAGTAPSWRMRKRCWSGLRVWLGKESTRLSAWAKRSMRKALNWPRKLWRQSRRSWNGIHFYPSGIFLFSPLEMVVFSFLEITLTSSGAERALLSFD